MTNNFNFIFKCKEYGVDQKDTTTHEEHIILSNKEKGKDILLDRDYNVIGVQDKIIESEMDQYDVDAVTIDDEPKEAFDPDFD